MTFRNVSYPVYLPDSHEVVGHMVITLPERVNPDDLIGDVVMFPVFAFGSMCTLHCQLGFPLDTGSQMAGFISGGLK